MSQAIQNTAQENLSQVWLQLSRECQSDVIRLMAQLIVRQIVAQLEKEGYDEQNSR